MHTKYEHSSLHGCWEIFDEKWHSSKNGRKENWTNTGKNKQEKTGFQSHDTTSHHQPAYQRWAFYLVWLMGNLWRKISSSMEGKKIGQIKGQISRRRLVFNPTIQQTAINLHTKYEHSSLHGCWEIFDEKFSSKMGRTEGWKGRTDGRTDINQYTPHFFKAGV